MTLLDFLTWKFQFLRSDIQTDLIADLSAHSAKDVFFRRTALFSPSFLNELPFQPLETTTMSELHKELLIIELLSLD